MVNDFNNISLMIFKMFELNSSLNRKTPLGLLSLMINLNHEKNFTHNNNKINEKDNGMEF